MDWESAPIIMGLKIGFGFKNFVGDFGGNFGFDNVFERRGGKDEFTEFLVKIPVVKKETGKPCDYCEGKGRLESFGTERECLCCRGKGGSYHYDWQTPYAISASFNVFFTLASAYRIKTHSPFPQLMTLDVATLKGFSGGAIGGQFSIPLMEWFNACDKKETAIRMRRAAVCAYKKMFIMIDDFEERDFRVRVDECGFILDCPGNSTGVFTGERNRYVGIGSELICHNLDTPMQQITLLAGLAALHDTAREEIKNTKG